MNVVYWFEPISILKQLKDEKGFWKLFFILFILVNYCTFGIFKIITVKLICLYLHTECHIRFCRVGTAINEMWTEKLSPYAFEL